MRILHVLAGFDAGGAERVALTLTSAVEGTINSVGLAAAAGSLDTDLPRRVNRFVLKPSDRDLATIVPTVSGIRAAISAYDPSLIHSHNPRMTALAHAARWTHRRHRVTPLLATQHSVMAAGDRSRSSLLLRPADRVVAVSDEVASALRSNGFKAEKLTVIRNGVRKLASPPPGAVDALNMELGIRGEAPVVVALGRLVSAKAHARLVGAAALLRERVPGVRVLIAGMGPLEGELRTLIRARGVESTVRLLGLRRDVATLLARAAVLAFSSDWEGLPIAALEAFSVGVPVVGTDVGELPSLIATGAGVVAARTPESLADALASVLLDERLRRECGAAAEEIYKREFRPELMVGAYERLYDELAINWMDPAASRHRHPSWGRRR